MLIDLTRNIIPHSKKYCTALIVSMNILPSFHHAAKNNVKFSFVLSNKPVPLGECSTRTRRLYMARNYLYTQVCKGCDNQFMDVINMTWRVFAVCGRCVLTFASSISQGLQRVAWYNSRW